MSVAAASSPLPIPDDLDAWLDSIHALAAPPCPMAWLKEQGFSHQFGVRHTKGFVYLEFSPPGLTPFYAYWQPVPVGPAPLLVHVPGYGAEMSAHPELVAQGYNVLHVSPLGYATPRGPAEALKRDGQWPVLPDTILTGARGGYRLWLANVAMAIAWARTQPEVLPDRLSFFGTSQGGGGALMLGSLYRGRGARCVAADLPFLTHFPLAAGRGAYSIAAKTLAALPDPAAGWRALAYVDTLSHAARLDLPVLLTAGGRDGTCPPETIEALFARLPATRSYTFWHDAGHRYSIPFPALAAGWFRLYA